jgi:hypothetical protein
MNGAFWHSELESVGIFSLPNYDNNLTLAIFVPAQSSITTMCFGMGSFQIPTKKLPSAVAAPI